MRKCKNLTGQKFGRLTVIERAENIGNKTAWRCVCECGNETIVRGDNLTSSTTQSCGCLQKEVVSKNSFHDLSGARFGRLTVIRRVENSNSGQTCFLCICDCGNEVVVHACSLMSRLTKSCGCLREEVSKTRNIKHGMSDSRIYKIYISMIHRCTNPKSAVWDCYGGRGISVCDEWMNDFMSFRTWALSNGYTDDLTIDRIDVNGNYCPENCRWVTMREQNRNKRDNHLISVNGETHCLSEWEEISGISCSNMQHRINNGWPPQAVIFAPVHTRLKTWLHDHPEYSLEGGNEVE